MDNPGKLANIGYTRQRQTNQNTTRYVQANTNNVYITRSFLETSGWKEEPNIGFYGNRNGHHNMEFRT